MTYLRHRRLAPPARRLPLAAAITGAAVMSLAACSAGIITGGHSAAPPSAGPSRSAAAPRSSSAAPKPSPSPSPSAVRMVRVNAPIRAFPVPPKAQLLMNASCYKQVGLELGPLTPRQTWAFYSKALPKAGYQITETMQGSPNGTGLPKDTTVIGFSGHGYSGEVTGFADMGAETGTGAASGSSFGILNDMTKNVAIILLNRPGVSDSYNCPGT